MEQPNYLHNFVQSLCDALLALDGTGVRGQTIALGGDGRFYNDTAAQLIINTLAANGASGVVVGQNALMSTPAVSACIRQRSLYGGIILSASHNPAGPLGDVGIKFNTSNGGPALEDLTDRIFAISKCITRVLSTPSLPSSISLLHEGIQTFPGPFTVTVVSSTQDYFDVLQSCFDFPLIRQLLSRPDFKLRFDAMHAVTGPYARELFHSVLSSSGSGSSSSCCVNATPLADFGGGHPDPNLVYARALVDAMISDPSLCLGAASDGDGDRNMILGAKGFFVCPCDSLAVIALHHHRIPLFAAPGCFPGVARSMPTSSAVDRVAQFLQTQPEFAGRQLPVYVTPTGWKFFGNLLDEREAFGGSGEKKRRIALCGEESFGTGAFHVREKDGLWAVLAWLQIIAHIAQERSWSEIPSVESIVKDMWSKAGRVAFQRHDYEGVSSAGGEAVMRNLEAKLAEAQTGHVAEVASAENFSYIDEVDGSSTSKQGLVFKFKTGDQFVARLSGTGSSGATVRFYFQRELAVGVESSAHGDDAGQALKDVVAIALKWSNILAETGRQGPDVIT